MASYVSNASKLAVKTPKATTPKVTTATTKPVTTASTAKPVASTVKQTVTNTPTAKTTSAPSYSSISDVHNLGKQYGMDSQMLGWISDKASNNQALDVSTPEKQAVYNAYQTYLKNEIQNKASQGVALSDPNAWKNSLYNSNVSQNLNQSYNNLNSTITDSFGTMTNNMNNRFDTVDKSFDTVYGRFDNVDTSLNKIDTGLENYYDQFDTFEQQMYTDHNGQFDLLKYIQDAVGGGATSATPTTPTTPTAPIISSPGHVYVPGESSNNEGYAQKQLVTNDLFNRYLQQIYQGGF